MSESLNHMNYVRGIVEYISTWPDCICDMIEADLPEFEGGRTTQVIGGFFPDVYYYDFNTIIIGEAKTDNDIENQHTYNQFDAYIEHVGIFPVKKHIIFSCSFYSFSALKNLVIRKKRRESLDNITFHILGHLHKPAII